MDNLALDLRSQCILLNQTLRSPIITFLLNLCRFYMCQSTFLFSILEKMASLDVSVRFSYRYSLPNCPPVACQVFIASTILQCSLHRWLLSSETNQNRMVYTMLHTSLKLLHEALLLLRFHTHVHIKLMVIKKGFQLCTLIVFQFGGKMFSNIVP